MTDIRKRKGAKGVTYQVRYPSKTSKSGYAYKTFLTLKEAREFRESGETKKTGPVRSGGGIVTVTDGIEKWLEVCEKEGRDGRDPVTDFTLKGYKYRAKVVKSYPWKKSWPHVWLGTTTENQDEADRRIPHLVAIPTAVRLLSVEPMVEPVDVAPWLVRPSHDTRAPISWIIVGGESGGGARPMHPDWLRGLRDQVHAAGAKLFVNQIGSNHALWPSVTGKGEDPA